MLNVSTDLLRYLQKKPYNNNETTKLTKLFCNLQHVFAKDVNEPPMRPHVTSGSCSVDIAFSSTRTNHSPHCISFGLEVLESTFTPDPLGPIW